MSTVYLERCDRCKTTAPNETPDAESVPPNWTWVDAGKSFEGALCPSCKVSFELWLNFDLASLERDLVNAVLHDIAHCDGDGHGFDCTTVAIAGRVVRARAAARR